MKKTKTSQDPDKIYEKNYKTTIAEIRKKAISTAIKKYGIEHFSENIGTILKESLPEVLPHVIHRSSRKWINKKGNEELQKLVNQNIISINEIHNLSKSIVNTLRPLAGGSFQKMICDTLNEIFEQDKIPVKAVTEGSIKTKLSNKLKETGADGQTRDYKPDLDIVVYNKKTNNPFLIISCKTTFRERIMQTINWKNFLSKSEEIKNIKIFVVTAWENLKNPTNRQRVSVLDGVYVTNKDVKVGGNIHKFDDIFSDIEQLAMAKEKSTL